MIRYKGSALGVIWSVINPLILLAVYTFVFSVVFKSKWGISTHSNKAEYALVIFSALVFYNVFSEVIIRSPGLILGNVNYVTKVVFPLPLLNVVALGNALVHSFVSLTVLLIGVAIFFHGLPLTVFYIPLIYIPLCLLSLGLSWFLSSLGVYLRDIGYIVNLIVQILFFMTPIFYSVTSLPKNFQLYMRLNPLTEIIDNARNVIIFGSSPNWTALGLVTLISMVIMLLGMRWFKTTRHGFVDVL